MFSFAGVKRLWWLIFSVMLMTTLLPAQEDAEKLRKAAQNPVASLISVPIQENWNFGIGPNDRVQNVMNVQPVIPFSLGKDWNLIVRWISPIIFQPVSSTESEGIYGLGDMNPSFLRRTEEEQGHLGCRPDLHTADGNEFALSGAGQIQHRADRGRPCAAWQLDCRRIVEQRLVGRRTLRSG